MEFGSGLTSIGSSAFYGCTGLTSVSTPSSLASLGSSAFQGCTSLVEAEINGTGLDLYNSSCVFYKCASLRRVVFGDGVTRLYRSYYSDYSNGRRDVSGTFGDCASLREVVVGSGVTDVADRFLWNVGNSGDGLSVSFGGRIGRVGYEALNNANVTTLGITLDNCAVGDRAFMDNPAVTLGSVDFSQIRSMDGSAFSGCRNIVGVYPAGGDENQNQDLRIAGDVQGE